MSVWTQEGGKQAAHTYAEYRDDKWFPVIQWNDGLETLAPTTTEPCAIAAADDLARRVLHPWYNP